jgi:hypothetical protein
MVCCGLFYFFYKIAFHCSRAFRRLTEGDVEPQVKHHTVHPSKTPWMWIGAEMKNGKIVTVTDTVNKYIEYDDVVDTKYLEVATNMTSGVSRWLYLDSKTLNEQEFPPEGLLIENDSVESATS